MSIKIKLDTIEYGPRMWTMEGLIIEVATTA